MGQEKLDDVYEVRHAVLWCIFIWSPAPTQLTGWSVLVMRMQSGGNSMHTALRFELPYLAKQAKAQTPAATLGEREFARLRTGGLVDWVLVRCLRYVRSPMYYVLGVLTVYIGYVESCQRPLPPLAHPQVPSTF